MAKEKKENGNYTSNFIDWQNSDIWWKQVDEIKHNLRHLYITGGEPFLSKSHNKLLDILIKDDFAKNITLRGSGGSDHAPFYNKKVPVAFLHTGLHEYYHTPKDTSDRINYDGLEKVSKYGFELAWTVCNAVERVEFDYGSFKELDLNHDHGQKDMPLEENP